MGICVVDVFFFDAVNKISVCGVAVISIFTVCDGDRVSSTFLVVMRCSLTFLRRYGVQPPPPHKCPPL